MPRKTCVDEIYMSYFQEIKKNKGKILTKLHETPGNDDSEKVHRILFATFLT